MTRVHPFRFRLSANPRAALFAMIATLTLTSSLVVFAANRFAVVGVENGTSVTIRMQHKWGNGPWTTDALPPHGRKWFWHTYERVNEDRSPTFRVQFDSDLSPGKVFNIPYELKKNAAPAHEWENAHRYIFTNDGSTKFIDLREE